MTKDGTTSGSPTVKEDILTSIEAATYLRFHLNTLYRYCKLGLIPGAKIGHDWRFKRSILQAWLEQKMLTQMGLGRRGLRSIDLQAVKRVGAAILLLFLIGTGQMEAAVKRGGASWYSYASAIQEGNSGVMANGQIFRDDSDSCASWDYPFGTALLVRSGFYTTRCVVRDRGPTHQLYQKGRVIDLSPKIFQALAPLEVGVIQVEIEEVK